MESLVGIPCSQKQTPGDVSVKKDALKDFQHL